MAKKNRRQRNRFKCLDCKVDTGKIGEFYFIHLELWLRAVGSKDGMLCIGCLESRLGRTLCMNDFTNATINGPKYGPKSARLMERLTAT